MIFFAKNKATNEIYIGYSKTPKKRFATLRKESTDELDLLGIIPGATGDRDGYKNDFFEHRAEKTGWFKPDILPRVQKILANPPPEEIHLIVKGDGELAWEDRNRVAQLVVDKLNEIHATRPIGWVVTGGDTTIDIAARQWANQKGVGIAVYRPNWKRNGKYAGFMVNPKMLKSMFDKKVALCFVTSDVSSGMQKFMRQLEKKCIDVIKMEFVGRYMNRLMRSTPTAATSSG